MCSVTETGCKYGQSCTETRPKESCELLADSMTFDISKRCSYSVRCSLIRRGNAASIPAVIKGKFLIFLFQSYFFKIIFSGQRKKRRSNKKERGTSLHPVSASIGQCVFLLFQLDSPPAHCTTTSSSSCSFRPSPGLLQPPPQCRSNGKGLRHKHMSLQLTQISIVFIQRCTSGGGGRG